MDTEKIKSFKRKISAKKIQKSFRNQQIKKRKIDDDALSRFLAPISGTQKAYVNSQFQKTDVVISKERINITGTMFKRLKPAQGTNSWLSGDIIDAWTFHLQSLQKNNFYFSYTFMWKLMSQKHVTFEDLKRLLLLKTAGDKRPKKYVQIFKRMDIFIPVHVTENHWVLVVVNVKDRLITYLDSLTSTPKVKSDIIEEIWSFFAQCAEDRDLNEKSINYHVGEWRVDENTESPQQRNTIDCGVFLCANMFYLSYDFSPNFTQENIPEIRYRIALTLLDNYRPQEIIDIE